MPAFDLFNSFLKLFNLDFRLAAFVDSIFNLIYLLFLFSLFTNLFVLFEVFSDSTSILMASNNSPETLFSC